MSAAMGSPARGQSDIDWIREEFGKRVTKELLDAKLEGFQKQIDAINKGGEDTKSIALSAKKRANMPHDCVQAEIIVDIKSEVSGWTKWFRVGLVSLIGAIIAIGGTALWRFSVLSSNVESTQNSIGRIENNVSGLETSHKDLTQAVTDLKKQDVARGQEQLGEIKATVTDAVRQAIKEERRSR